MVHKIYRDEASKIKELKGWLVIYGRRKIGKTFLIKNFLVWDAYFLVRRDGKILAEKIFPQEIGSIADFTRIVSELLKANKTIVIDEFQRLPDFVFDELAALHPHGKIIFSGSSMRIVEKILGKRSPLLGLTQQYRLDLIGAKNIVRECFSDFGRTGVFEFGPYLRDPWSIAFLRAGRTTEMLYSLLNYSKLTIPALIGEIFTEEERELTKIYEAVLRVLGSGVWDYKELAGILSSRKIIERGESALVLPYIKNLLKMGLVEELPLFGSNKKMYKLRSPVMELFYYLADRYNFDERDVWYAELAPPIERRRDAAVQNFIADLFAEHYGGQKEYYTSPAKEIDFIITSRGKPLAVGEVKWGKYKKENIENFIENVKELSAEKIFIVKKKREKEYSGVKLLDASDLLKICRAK